MHLLLVYPTMKGGGGREWKGKGERKGKGGREGEQGREGGKGKGVLLVILVGTKEGWYELVKSFPGAQLHCTHTCVISKT
jgi:hypothetical protein